MTLLNGTLYVGGEFRSIGGVPHSNFAALTTSLVGVEDREPPRPAAVRCAPNPARAAVVLTFALSRSSMTEIGVYDLAGRLVRRLDAGALAAGEHRRQWDGRDDNGAIAPPGLYLARVRTGDEPPLTGKILRVE